MSRFLLAGWGFIASIFILFLANPVLAGGGRVYVRLGSTDSSWSNSEYKQIVAKVHLHPDVLPCIGTKVTFKYEDQKEGDKVSTESIDSNTYVIKEAGGRWLNGKSVYDCGTYAKYFSKNRELKYAIIAVTTPKGETHERKVALNFQSNEPIIDSDESLPWDSELFPQPSNSPAPSSNINAWVLNQQPVNGSTNRNVVIKWGAFDGHPGTFKIYVKAATNKNDWEETFDGSKGPSANITLRTDQDYHLKVYGCMDKFGICADSNILTLPKLKNNEGGKRVISQEPTPISSLTISPTPAGGSNQVSELDKKMENLQNQLEESRKTQSVLEQRINVLVNFIKSLFPFFK